MIALPPTITEQPDDDDRCDHDGCMGHHCLNHDGLWICEQCPEFDTCRCFEDKPLACAPLGSPTAEVFQPTG